MSQSKNNLNTLHNGFLSKIFQPKVGGEGGVIPEPKVQLPLLIRQLRVYSAGTGYVRQSGPELFLLWTLWLICVLLHAMIHTPF